MKKARRTRKRPVLQFRVSETEYEELAEAAKSHNLTISEEAALRMRKYPRLSYSELDRLVIRAARLGASIALETWAHLPIFALERPET